MNEQALEKKQKFVFSVAIIAAELSFFVGYLSYQYIEKKFLQWGFCYTFCFIIFLTFGILYLALFSTVRDRLEVRTAYSTNESAVFKNSAKTRFGKTSFLHIIS